MVATTLLNQCHQANANLARSLTNNLSTFPYVFPCIPLCVLTCPLPLSYRYLAAICNDVFWEKNEWFIFHLAFSYHLPCWTFSCTSLQASFISRSTASFLFHTVLQIQRNTLKSEKTTMWEPQSGMQVSVSVPFSIPWLCYLARCKDAPTGLWPPVREPPLL